MTTVANAALFILNAYHAHKDAQGQNFLDQKALPLPPGWALLEIEDQTEKGGDYAAIFVNHANKEIFIAGRGTAQLSDTKTFPGILFGLPPEERIESAESIVADIRKYYPGYHLQAGGSSLDGLVYAKVSARDEHYHNDPDKAPLSVLSMNAPNTPLGPKDKNGCTRVVAIVENLDAIGHYGPDYANVIKLDAAFGFLNQFGAKGTHSIRNLLMHGIAENGYLLDQELSNIDPIAVIGGGVAGIIWQGQTFVQSATTIQTDIQADGTIHARKIDRMGSQQVYNGVFGHQYPTHTEQSYLKPNGLTYRTSTFFDEAGQIISVANKKFLQPDNIAYPFFTDSPLPGIFDNANWYHAPAFDPTQPAAIDNSRAPKIHVYPEPQAQQRIDSEMAAVNRVEAGYIIDEATYSVQYDAKLLFDTSFTATQQASLASGGVRPGAVQLDPNPTPNSFLEKHLTLGHHETLVEPNFASPALLNAAAIGSLASGSTQQVYIDPILLDLTGQGVHMTDYATNGVLFDVDHSGKLHRTGWADTKTGILVDDKGSADIQDSSYLFSEYYGGLPNERKYTDGYAALKAVDTNKDGVIDHQDAVWQYLKVWVDANHNAHSEAGELKTVEELGISKISLLTTPALPNEMRDGNLVRAYSRFTMNDREYEALSVDFLADPTSTTVAQLAEGRVLASKAVSQARLGFGTHDVSFSDPAEIKTYISESVEGKVLDAVQLGVDHLYGGFGNDTLIAAAHGSWLAGGGGSNIYQGGAGDDVFIISANDRPENIHGGGGTNTAIIVGQGDVLLNMQEAEIHIAEGGPGNNVIISGGGTGVYIRGGSGSNVLVGGSGDDVIVGGSGHNFIVGGSGKAIIYAGPQGDDIYGAEGDSIIRAGGGHDRIIAGPGNDVIEVGCGNAEIDGGLGTNIVRFHGSYGEYQIEKTADGYSVSDKLPHRDGKVTLRNIHKFAFTDISVVHLNQAAPAPVLDNLRVNREGQAFDRLQPHTITPAQLLANDQPFNSQLPLKIIHVSEAIGGTVLLNAAGEIVFTPNPQFTGMMQFTYAICDANGHTMQIEHSLTGEQAGLRAIVSLLTPDMPSDPLITQQWYLNAANIFPVWTDYTGRRVRIGQFEPSSQFATGPEILNYEHPDLAANIDPLWLAAEKAKGTLPTAFSNHATMVAGVMVAAKNGLGIVGVAFDAKMIGYALDSRGMDIKGLGYMPTVDVVNHSWGAQPDFSLSRLTNNLASLDSLIFTTIEYAASYGRGGLGSVIVCSAGNEREQGGSAQGFIVSNNRFVIQVGAINAAGDLSTLQIKQRAFSNPGSSILISAPGSNILSTSQMLKTDQGSIFGQELSATQGTSFATPVVSGIVALMLEANPYLGYRDIQHILLLTAKTVNDPHTIWSNNHARHWNGGGLHVSHDYGFGTVDARAAVRLAETWLSQSTAENELTLSKKTTDSHTSQQGKIHSTISMPAGLNIEHVEIDLDITFNDLSDLIVKLISPTKTESLLLNRHGINPADIAKGEQTNSTGPGTLAYRFMTTHDWGEISEGEWTLAIKNVKSHETTTLTSWALHLYGSKHTIDNTYFYTDDYPEIVKENAQPIILDGAIDGSSGGRNTIHAAAVSGYVYINLLLGEANIHGQGVTIHRPHEFHNLISGDGNDVLVANHAGAILDGGRGKNLLIGGQGKDLFIIHRRPNGLDTLEDFNKNQGDKIYLVGFTGLTPAELVLTTEGSNLHIALPDGQRLIVKKQDTGPLDIQQTFIMQDILNVPRAYVDSSSEGEAGSDHVDTVMLSGESGGVSFVGTSWALAGKVYEHNQAPSNRFIVAPHAEVKDAPGLDKKGAYQGHKLVSIWGNVESETESPIDYHNNVRGFKPTMDKLDLSLVGIDAFDDLIIQHSEHGVINGVAVIQGTEILRRSTCNSQPAVLAYLDAVDASQITPANFIFAKEVPKPVQVFTTPDWKKYIEMGINHLHEHPPQRPAGSVKDDINPIDTSASIKPVILSLSDDATYFTAIAQSNVYRDWHGVGSYQHMAWTGQHQGFLAFDKNEDGRITDLDEIAFVDYLPTAQTDLEGLRAFDANQDDLLDQQDAAWPHFGVWQDKNGNGQYEVGEFNTLDNLHIQSISLSSDQLIREVEDVTILGIGKYTWQDGRQGILFDAALHFEAHDQFDWERHIAVLTDNLIHLQGIASHDEGNTFDNDENHWPYIVDPHIPQAVLMQHECKCYTICR